VPTRFFFCLKDPDEPTFIYTSIPLILKRQNFSLKFGLDQFSSGLCRDWIRYDIPDNNARQDQKHSSPSNLLGV